MALYTVHIPDKATRASAHEDIVLVKEGFCWPAFAFSGLWLLWHRLWLAFAGFVIIVGLLVLARMTLGLAPAGIDLIVVLLSFGLGLEASALRQAKLACLGYQMAGIAGGNNMEEAERKAFAAIGATTPSVTGIRSVAPRLSVPLVPGHDAIIGMFPDPARRG